MTSSEMLEEHLAHGNARLVAQDRAGAKTGYLRALALDGDCVPALANLAAVALTPERTAATIALLRRAVAVDPENGPAWSSLAGAYWRAQRFDEAHAALVVAARLAPSWIVDYRFGLVYYSIGDMIRSEAYLRRAHEAKPDQASLALDYAHAVLKAGDLARGLKLFEARWQAGLVKNPIWDSGLPQWRGEQMAGGRLLLHHEQGFGDTIQFSRFIPMIKARAGHPQVILAVPPPLRRLFEDQSWIDHIVSAPESVAKVIEMSEFQCPLMSAVAVLEPTYQTLPLPAPYLNCWREHTVGLHAGGAKLAIGICWAASDTPWAEQAKSVDVEELLDLGSLPGVKLWSLQFGPRAHELRASGADALISELPGGPGDFADTAAIIRELDLVVSIDSACAHLAGALGKTVFMLNPLSSCWRWANGAAPWYRSMTIFDQAERGNWRAPIARIKDRIAIMLGERG